MALISSMWSSRASTARSNPISSSCRTPRELWMVIWVEAWSGMPGKWFRASRATARSWTMTPSTPIPSRAERRLHEAGEFLLLDQGIEGDVNPCAERAWA